MISSPGDSVGLGFEVRGLGVRFGETIALDGLDLEIAPGERVAFVGPSGSGKTTLLRVLNGTQRATSGEIAIGGRALTAMRERELRRLRARIGFVHQDLALIPNVRVSQNVIAGAVGRGSTLGVLREFVWPRRSTLRSVHALLERVGIGDKLFVRADRLSGGQRQRVAIARALFQSPGAILADEPVSSVDPSRARDTVDLLSGISRDDGITLCMSLHDFELAREFFPRLIGLRAGRIVFDARGEDLDAHDITALYALDRTEMLADGS